MMKDLIHKIDIVLNDEKMAYAANGRYRGGLGTFNIMIGDAAYPSGKKPKELNDISDTETIRSPNASLLLKLYSKISHPDKVRMKSYLLSQLTKDGSYFEIAYLIFFVLFRIGFVIEAIEKARINLKGDSNHGFSNMLGMFAKIVRFEYAFISEQEFESIKKAMEGESEHSFGLLQKINCAEIKFLERELDDVNPEINTDRDKILDIWATRFGSSEVPNIVKEIEEYFFEGGFTPNKYATCIGRIRIFVIEAVREIASIVSRKLNDSKVTANMNEHALFDYLRSTKTISDNEWNLLRTIYGMASNDGAHAAIATREYARITKNISYETILMLLEHSDKKF